MKRTLVLFSLLVVAGVIGFGTLRVQAQFGPPSPERQAAIAETTCPRGSHSEVTDH